MCSASSISISSSAKTRTPSRKKSACSTPALRSTSASAILSSSAIGHGSFHQVWQRDDENHPMAARVNSDFYTALGTLPSSARKLLDRHDPSGCLPSLLARDRVVKTCAHLV